MLLKGGKHILLIDNFDSFTYTIADYLGRLGCRVKVLERNCVTQAQISAFDGIVFSPGPGSPADLPQLQELVQFALENKPVFGICLGFQAIAFHFGSDVLKGKPMHGKISSVQLTVPDHWLFDGIPAKFPVVRYHSLIVKEVNSPLIPLAITNEQEIMALAHQELPIAAVQYHPEAYLTAFGLQTFKNWINFC